VRISSDPLNKEKKMDRSKKGRDKVMKHQKRGGSKETEELEE